MEKSYDLSRAKPVGPSTPAQRRAGAEAATAEAQSNVAPEAAAANVAQSQGSAASSAATAARTEALTPLEVEEMQEKLRKMRIENLVAERAAAQEPAPSAERVAQQTKLANMNATADAINLLMKQFNTHLAGQGLVKSTLEYFPSDAKGRINSTAAGLAESGLAVFKVPGAGSQSDADAARFVEANQPSTFDNDFAYLGKLYNLRRRLDAHARAMGLPPIRWIEPVEVAARQYLSLPEEERSKLGVREVGTFKDVPADLLPPQGEAPATADASAPLEMNEAFSAPVPMEAAAFGAKETSIRIPPEMQAEMDAWFEEHPRGTVGLKEYANFRRALDDKYGFRPGLKYEDDPRTTEFLKQYNDPDSPVNTAIPPVLEKDTRNVVERAAGTAVSSPVGTTLATGVSGLGLNALDAVMPRMAELRELNPTAATVGDVLGSIGGNAVLRNTAEFVAPKVLSSAPDVLNYLQSSRKGVDFTRNLLGDVTQGVTYGAAVEDDPYGGAASATTSNILSNLGGKFGRFVTQGADRSPVAQELMDRYGITDLTIGQQSGGFPKAIEDAATSVPVVGDIINARRAESMLDLNKAAFREVGGQPIGYGDPAVASLAGLREKAYTDALAGKEFDLENPVFVQGMEDALGARDTLTDALARDFDIAVQNSLRGTRIGDTGTMSGEGYQQAQRALSGYKSAAQRPGFEKDYRDALSGVSGVLREEVERQSPDLVPLLREADTMYRGEKILQDAVSRAKMDPTGLGADVFTPGNLTQAVAASGRRYPGTPPLKPLSRLAQNVIPSDLPDSGTARRTAIAALGTAGLGGVIGAGAGYSPEQGVSIADIGQGALTTLSPLALLALGGTRRGQKMLSKMMFDRPEMPETAVKVADLYKKYAPSRVVAPGLTPVLMPEEQEEPVVRSASEEAALAAKAAPAAQEGAGPEIIQVGRFKAYYDPTIDKLVDVETGQPFDIGDGDVGEATETGTVMYNGREAYVDPKTGEYKDAKTGKVLAKARGGSVQRLNKGGQPKRKQGYDYANAARTLLGGAAFDWGDEIEARVLAPYGGKAYENELARIRKGTADYAARNPNTAKALAGAGMIGGSVLAPSLAGARVLANAPRAGRFLAGAIDALAQGALSSAGGAEPNPKEAGSGRMTAVGNDVLRNAIDYGLIVGAGATGKRLAKTKPGQAAIGFATRPVRYAVQRVRGR